MQTFYLSDFEKFLNEYEIDNKIYEFNRSGISIPLADILFAFRCFVHDDKNAVVEYFKIINILENISNIRNYFYGSNISFIQMNFDIEKLKSDLEYIIGYQGAWDADRLLIGFRLDRQTILKDLDQLKNDFPRAKQVIQIEKKKQKDEFIEKYYEKERLLSREEMNELFNSKINKIIYSDNRHSRDYLDVSKIKYPIILFLYENNVLVGVSKVIKNLEQRIVNYKKTKSFDSYLYIYFPENLINDV